MDLVLRSVRPSGDDTDVRAPDPSFLEQVLHDLDDHMGEEAARHLALPRLGTDGETQWIIDGLNAVPVSAFEGSIAEGLLRDASELLDRMLALRDRLAASASPTERALAERLHGLVRRASPETTFLVDSRLVLTDWLAGTNEPMPGPVPQPESLASVPGLGGFPRSTVLSVMLLLLALVLLAWIVLRLLGACSMGLTTSRLGIPGFDFLNACESEGPAVAALRAERDRLRTELADREAGCVPPLEPVQPEEVPPRQDTKVEPEPEPGPPVTAKLKVTDITGARAELCPYAACNPGVTFRFDGGPCENDPGWIDALRADVPSGQCRVLVLPQSIAPGGGTFTAEITLTINGDTHDIWTIEADMVEPGMQSALLQAGTPHVYWAGDFPLSALSGD